MVTHELSIRGAAVEGDGRPVILERTDQEFIPGILEELSRKNGLETVLATRAKIKENNKTGVLQLFQPVHQTFHVALLDVSCNSYGRPRLDPDRIESAGLVVRRVAVGSDGKPVDAVEGWVQEGRAIRGWISFPTKAHEELDPEPERRRFELRAGHPEIDRRLALQFGNSALRLGRESTSSLFVAPPDVCRAVGRTLLYGVIPVTSFEVSERPAQTPPFDQTWFDENLRGHLPTFLRSGVPVTIPRKGALLTPADADPDQLDQPGNSELKNFVLALRQVKLEFGAFDDRPERAQNRVLFELLNQVTLDPNTADTRKMGDFLKEATRVLVDSPKDKNTPQLRMPNNWPSIDETLGARILARIKEILLGRLKELTAGQGRFDEPKRQYRLRAFVRVKQPAPCPPVTFWSEYSEPFTIAPWYEPTDRPPVQVPLPDFTDLKSLGKPNVAFNVPKQLFNFLADNDPKKILKGEGNSGSGGGTLDWICGFNIPIITFCAFIVLNLFLQLFDLIFKWMLFIKICIPFPRKK